ncbi:MAG: NAD-dependent epimerase/dehydratase family protein [Bdellovibrionales bacterium]|nr:NAD-dependent epimerase/dehydratase family protein [Bdellovibrionales bacterium]
MKKTCVLVTGAAGEIGHNLIERLKQPILALDIVKPDQTLPSHVDFRQGSVTDKEFIKSLGDEFSFSAIIHLAGVLSSGSEEDPFHAHDLNVNGSLNMLHLAHSQAQTENRSPVFVFASTIAVYSINPPFDKFSAGKINEEQFLNPVSMYGMNKLYVERLGQYFSTTIRTNTGSRVDFRALRFPGILSAETVPTTGTSDYGPLMLHAAAKGEAYSCFVPEDATLNFMVMPDAVEALVGISGADAAALTRRVYNVTSFSVTAAEIKSQVLKAFPQAEISFDPVSWRTNLISSWPMDTDDSAARSDWGWIPRFNREQSFQDYLVPGVRRKYGLGLDH